MKTTIRTRIMKLSLISVAVAFACYITLAVYAVRYLSVDIQETLISKDVEIVNSAIETIYIDMKDLAAEICDHEDLLEAYNNGSVYGVIEDYLNDSWIQGAKVVDNNGSTIYSYGLDCDISRTMYGHNGRFTMITSSKLGSGTLYLACYPDEIGLFAKIIDDKMIDFVVRADGKEIYNSLGADNIASEFKYNGRNYISRESDSGAISVIAIEDITSMRSVLIQVVIVFIVLAAILAPVSVYVSRRSAGAISNSIKNIVNRLHMLAEGDLTSSVVKLSRGDETQVLEDTLDKTISEVRIYIDDIKAYAAAIHNGDIGVKTGVEYKGDFRGLYTSMKAIQSDLDHIVRETREAVDNVNSASREIMQSNRTLADGSTEQAANTEEMSSAMHEISSTVTRNDADCTAARNASDQVVVAVGQVRDNGDKLRDAMKNIESMMGEIQKIFNALEDIAFDTNILAINASIEAAHAGSAGVGFAVVAAEVADLAVKSHKSVEESTELLKQLTVVIDNGRKFTDQTADSVYEVEKAIHALNKNISKVAEATSQQAVMLGQITTGIDNIADITQTNSATSEENFSISESLVYKVETVSNMLKKYKLDEVITRDYDGLHIDDEPEITGGTDRTGGYEEPAVYESDEDADFSGIFEDSENEDGYAEDGSYDEDDGIIEVDYPENYVPDMPEDSDE